MDSPKRSEGEGDVEDERPKKVARSGPKKFQKVAPSSPPGEGAEAASASTIRVVVARGWLHDGDGSLELPDQPPKLRK